MRRHHRKRVFIAEFREHAVIHVEIILRKVAQLHAQSTVRHCQRDEGAGKRRDDDGSPRAHRLQRRQGDDQACRAGAFDLCLRQPQKIGGTLLEQR